MPRGFTLTLTMKNATQAKKALPIMQAAMIYEEINEDGSLPQETLNCIKNCMNGGREENEISVANLELNGKTICMECNPGWDKCEGGACGAAIEAIARYYPNFAFEYESLYEDTIADMYYTENAYLKNGEFDYYFSEDTPADTSAKHIKGTYQNGKWEFSTKKRATGRCSCGSMIECDEDDETECMCGRTYTYKELTGEDEVKFDDSDPNVADIKKKWKIRGLDDGTYGIKRYKVSAKRITIPAQIGNVPITEIGDYAFENRSALGSIIIPDGVKKIGAGAFWGCKSLGSITIPDDTESIGPDTFRECSSLQNVTLPQKLSVIHGGTFEFCNSLENIIIPDGVEVIGEDAFGYCEALSSITMPKGLKVIDKGAFRECTALTNIDIPNEVEEIGVSAFYKCDSLTSVIMPQSLKDINAYAFEECSSLTDIMIPNGVEVISEGTFRKCSSLTDITIPEGVKKIYSGAFVGCSSLKKITLPSSVTEIDARAFPASKKLTISAPAGSYAEEYARSKGIKFVPDDNS